MWKLWHRLFGWEYVSHVYGYENVVRRLRVAPNGAYYVERYGGSPLFIDELKGLRHLTRREENPPS